MAGVNSKSDWGLLVACVLIVLLFIGALVMGHREIQRKQAHDSEVEAQIRHILEIAEKFDKGELK